MAYDAWGNLTDFDQDVDSVVGGGGRGTFGIDYAYSKATPGSGAGLAGGRATVRRDSMTMPLGVTVTYGYGAANSINDYAVRVAKLTTNSVDIASYDYLGSGQVVTSVPSAMWR